MPEVGDKETIVAQATPSGQGGIGVVRLSGNRVSQIAKAMIGKLPVPRYATYSRFLDDTGATIDEGIALYFPSPHSFTGEHVLELQGHGGPVVINMLLERCVELGARLARPGEFSERAFLNDKIDLSQAEAIADLIDSASRASARGAVRSLQGEFSNQIRSLTEEVINLRIYVEAAIDFPEEEIDFLADEKVEYAIQNILSRFSVISKQVEHGVLLREGVSLVLVGKPNAGKSSLLNVLTGRDSAIVTDIAGTTRDVINEHIQIDGLPLRLVDTAGIREAKDVIEAEGLRRTHLEIEKADRVLLVVDSGVGMGKLHDQVQALQASLPAGIPTTVVLNKIDLNGRWEEEIPDGMTDWLGISVMTGEGIAPFRAYLKQILGFANEEEGAFVARSRHLDAINRAHEAVEIGYQRLQEGAGELLAEELKLCQQILGEITGEFTSDDLLGRIFSSFCIGK